MPVFTLYDQVAITARAAKISRVRAGLCNSTPAVPDLPTLQNGSNLSHFLVDFF